MENIFVEIVCFFGGVLISIAAVAIGLFLRAKFRG